MNFRKIKRFYLNFHLIKFKFQKFKQLKKQIKCNNKINQLFN